MSNILLIEEISLARFNLKKKLVQMGYTVYDYESAERMFADAYILEKTDLLIFSTNIESECVEFNKRVKNIRHNLPIVFISREFSKETFSVLSKSGAVNFILKPIDYEEFGERIKGLLPSRMLMITVDELINSEIARANRGKYSVSVMTISLEEDGTNSDSNNNMISMFSRLREDSAHLYRSVDTIFELGNQLMIVLPFTKKEGVPVVIDKLVNHMKENELRFPHKIKVGAATYPEECYNAESLLELANNRMLKYNEANPEKLKKNENAEKIKKNVFVNSSSEMNLKAINDGGAVKLSWDNIKGAGRYEVNRYNDDILEESKFVYINRYTDNFVKIQTAYTYQVRALSKTSQTLAEAHALIFVKR